MDFEQLVWWFLWLVCCHQRPAVVNLSWNNRYKKKLQTKCRIRLMISQVGLLSVVTRCEQPRLLAWNEASIIFHSGQPGLRWWTSTAASQSKLQMVFWTICTICSDRGCTCTSVQMVLAGRVANTSTDALKQTLWLDVRSIPWCITILAMARELNQQILPHFLRTCRWSLTPSWP